MADFLGAWRVTEYVYNPDGALAGRVHQHRRLHRLENGKIRVTQACRPEASLNKHIMGKFAGEWVFDLTVDGRVRRYEGPDVIGNGVTWGDGVMSGRGIWPRFGHNFTSFSVMPTDGLQITGGKFFSAVEMKANIIGIAKEQPASDNHLPNQWPTLNQQKQPPDIASHWQGQSHTYQPDGTLITTQAATRIYTTTGSWQENDQEIILEQQPNRWQVTGRDGISPIIGLGKQYGCQLEMSLFTNNGKATNQQQWLDATNQHLISWQQHFLDNTLQKITIVKLKPV